MSGHAYAAEAMPTRQLAGRRWRRGPLAALGIAGLCLVGLVLTWVVAELMWAGQVRDSMTLHDFVLLSRPRVDSVANALVHLLNPLPFACAGVALVACALLRKRPRVAVAVALVMALAPLTAEALKPLLAHSHLQMNTPYVPEASWPSGHSTAALALVLCAVLVAPVRLRPLVSGLGAAFAVAVGCSLLILAWHMPSDVLGGYLLAALCMALAVAGLRAAEQRWPSGEDPVGRSGVSRPRVRIVRARVPK